MKEKLVGVTFMTYFPAESGVFFDLPYHTPYLHF